MHGQPFSHMGHILLLWKATGHEQKARTKNMYIRFYAFICQTRGGLAKSFHLGKVWINRTWIQESINRLAEILKKALNFWYIHSFNISSFIYTSQSSPNSEFRIQSSLYFKQPALWAFAQMAWPAILLLCQTFEDEIPLMFIDTL